MIISHHTRGFTSLGSASYRAKTKAAMFYILYVRALIMLD